MLSFANKAEANLVTAEQLAAAKIQIAALTEENEALKSATSSFDVTISGLKTALEAKEADLKKLQDDLQAAQAKANAVIASQGLPIDSIPAQAPNASISGTATSPLSELRKQLAQATDPKDKFRLSVAIRDLLTPKPAE